MRWILSILIFITGYTASAQDEVLYMWSGALTPSSIKVNAKLADTSAAVRLAVSPDKSFDSPVYSEPKAAITTSSRMVSLTVDGLLPGTRYYYAIESNGVLDDSEDDIGSFKTPSSGPFSYSFVVGSCAISSDHPVYTAMKKFEPLFYLNMGDLHYSDINSTSFNAYRSAYENAVLSKPPAAEFLREVPIAYMWDDHDFCGNDSDGSSIGKSAARKVYQEYVPHYPLAAGSGDVPVYQSFSIGRVRFVLTDLRSERSSRSMLGRTQKLWMYDQMIEAQNNNQMIAWVSTVPYIGSYHDTWGGYVEERRELGDFFKSNINNMFILGGDAHMIAIDNGDNTDYSGGFRRNSSKYPIFQASALNQSGSEKGGNYSHGTFPNPSYNEGQFGLVTVTDNGGEEVCITFTGYRVAGAGSEPVQLASYSFCRNVGAELKFKIYPNPAQNAFTLMIYNAQNDQATQVSIIDLQGREVYESAIDVAGGENTFDVRFGSLPAGVYIVQFVVDNEMHTARLIIAE
jgi:phosphodiesterase/alkaline phosphatase D-like protein